MRNGTQGMLVSPPFIAFRERRKSHAKMVTVETKSVYVCDHFLNAFIFINLCYVLPYRGKCPPQSCLQATLAKKTHNLKKTPENKKPQIKL